MADEIKGLTRLTEAYIKPAAETAARAFYDYPLSAYFIPDASRRIKKQAAAFEGLIRSGVNYGEVYATSPNLEGIAVWFPPDYQPKPPRPRPFFARLWASLFADKELINRPIVFGEYATEVRKRVLPTRHWYLQLLGVEPAFQGKGFSSALVKPILERADREGLPCYLETHAEKNVALYEHFGFRVVEEGIIPGSDVKSWAMMREGNSNISR